MAIDLYLYDRGSFDKKAGDKVYRRACKKVNRNEMPLSKNGELLSKNERFLSKSWQNETLVSKVLQKSWRNGNPGEFHIQVRFF